MSRNDSTAFFRFLVGIGVGAAAVILLGSKRIDQLRDDVSEIVNDGAGGTEAPDAKDRQHRAAEVAGSNRHRRRRLQRSPKVVTPSYLIADA